jgi:hypothetical protein
MVNWDGTRKSGSGKKDPEKEKEKEKKIIWILRTSENY